jgi:hypothetical protein
LSIFAVFGSIGANVLKIVALVGLLGAFLGSGTLLAATKSVEAKPMTPLKPSQESSALVGQVKVELVGPAGLDRVDGLNPAADAFIESLKELFKLRVLAVYAEPQAYENFASGLASHNGRSIPRLGIITATTRMEKKSYDAKGLIKEKRRYRERFSLAINTRPLAWLFGRKANKKLEEKLGLNVGFSYKTSQETGRFDERDRSLSFSVLATMTFYDVKSDFLLAASVLNVGDKLVYVAWVEPFIGPESLTKARSANLGWLLAMAKANGLELTPVVEDNKKKS